MLQFTMLQGHIGQKHGGGRFRFKVVNEERKDTWSEVPAAV